MTFKLDEDGYYDFTQVDALLGGPSIPYFIRPSDFRRRKVKTQVVALHSLKDCRNKANNQCAAALTETYKGSHHAGPAIALSRTAGPSYEGVFQDITLSDFRVAVDYFIFTGTLMGLDAKCREKYEDKLATERMLHKSFVTKLVGGVKTNCRADEDLSGLGAFVPVNVQHDQPIYESKPTEMLFLMGHPLLFWQYPHKMSWNDGKSLQNHAVKTMGMSYSPAYANWAYHPTLDMSAGSWLVVREDGKDLTVTQLSVLLKYYEEVLLPKIKELPGSPFLKEWPHKEALQIREKWITRDVFEEYLQGYNTRRAAEDPNWVDVVSPCINLEAFPGSGVLKADK